MNILIDIGHPAHVHFFKNPIRKLVADGHEVSVTSRSKEMTLPLLDSLEVPHVPLSSQGDGAISLLAELVTRDYRLFRFARRFKPDVMAEIGGVFVAHVGRMLSIPAVVFYDTENAHLQNLLTYPFATKVVVPDCYQAWTPRNKTVRYRGYHELSYLAPQYFRPDLETAIHNGLEADQLNYFVRLVSWRANHDVGEQGLNLDTLHKIVAELSASGNVMISSEASLPREFDSHMYRGQHAAVHHVLAFCSGFIGESATMASECAVLGVPAVYVARTGRGYTDQQEARYGLVRNVREPKWAQIHEAIQWLEADSNRDTFSSSRDRMLADSVDVVDLVIEQVLLAGESGARFRSKLA